MLFLKSPQKEAFTIQIIKSPEVGSTTKLNNFIAQIMVKKFEGSREVMALLQFLKSLELSTFKSQPTKTLCDGPFFANLKVFTRGTSGEGLYIMASRFFSAKIFTLKFLQYF